MKKVDTRANIIVKGDVFMADKDVEHVPMGFNFGILYVGHNSRIFVHDYAAAVSLAKAASEIMKQFEAHAKDRGDEGAER